VTYHYSSENTPSPPSPPLEGEGMRREPDVLGLAKARSGEEGTEREFERVFLPGVEEPVILEPTSATTHLVARVRDEAHRFAITYHRKLREKRAVHSELDDIPGIGEKRKKALLRHFGSVDKIRRATVEELVSVSGMNKKAAEEISEFYKRKPVERGQLFTAEDAAVAEENKR